jgi:hypothetical protein
VMLRYSRSFSVLNVRYSVCERIGRHLLRRSG